jgi:hypothetical protein
MTFDNLLFRAKQPNQQENKLLSVGLIRSLEEPRGF